MILLDYSGIIVRMYPSIISCSMEVITVLYSLLEEPGITQMNWEGKHSEHTVLLTYCPLSTFTVLVRAPAPPNCSPPLSVVTSHNYTWVPVYAATVL